MPQAAHTSASAHHGVPSSAVMTRTGVPSKSRFINSFMACPFELLFGSLEVVAVAPPADEQCGDEHECDGEQVPHAPSPVFVAHRFAIIALMVALVFAMAMSCPAR